MLRHKPGDQQTRHQASGLLLVCLCCPALCGAAAISVKTDRNPVALEESFQLIFEAIGEVDGEPDFTPLNRDFQMLSSSSSSSMSIVNTGITRTKQWQLTLLPLRAGELVIPPIAFGKALSPRSKVTVRAVADTTGPQQQQDVFIEVELSSDTALVQAEIIYTIKLYRTIATANESLSAPALSKGEAVIEQLDADQSAEMTIQGRYYRVFQRHYAIYPQASGVLAIAPVRFQAQLSARATFAFDPFAPNTRTIVRQSEPLQVDVKPAPASYQARHWLPAAELTLTEQWSKDPLSLTPGEPATRTVTLTARGLTASQLPALPEQLPAGFRQYPDAPVLEDRHSATGITGVRQQKYAIIPARAGEYTLPAITLPWWNTQTQTMAQAALPARKVRVRAAAVGGDIATLPTVAPALPEQSLPGSASGAAVVASDNNISRWQWLSGVLALLWGLTLLYMLRRRAQPARGARPTGDGSAAAAQRELRRACAVNDPQRAKTALLQWSVQCNNGSPAASLGELEKYCSEQLAAELRKLSRQLYSGATGAWQGSLLWEAFAQEDTPRAAGAQVASELEPLFKL